VHEGAVLTDVVELDELAIHQVENEDHRRHD